MTRLHEIIIQMLASLGMEPRELADGTVGIFKLGDSSEALGALEIFKCEKSMSSGRGWDLRRVESWPSASSLLYALQHKIMWLDKPWPAEAKTWLDGKMKNPWLGKSFAETFIALDLAGISQSEEDGEV